MKSLPCKSSVCLLGALLAGCQAAPFPMPDIRESLNALDFDLNSSSYVVRAGETLETIAFRYDTSVAELQQLNPEAAFGVYTGMRLEVRQPIGGLRTPTRNAAWSSEADFSQPSAVQMTPVPARQAVPVVARATDPYLLDTTNESVRLSERLAAELPASELPANELPIIVRSAPQAYTEQTGYPVEEVIDDENFTLPRFPCWRRRGASEICWRLAMASGGQTGT